MAPVGPFPGARPRGGIKCANFLSSLGNAFVLRRISRLPGFSHCVILNRLRASSQNRYMQTLTSKVHFRRLRRVTRDDEGT